MNIRYLILALLFLVLPLHGDPVAEPETPAAGEETEPADTIRLDGRWEIHVGGRNTGVELSIRQVTERFHSTFFKPPAHNPLGISVGDNFLWGTLSGSGGAGTIFLVSEPDEPGGAVKREQAPVRFQVNQAIDRIRVEVDKEDLDPAMQRFEIVRIDRGDVDSDPEDQITLERDSLAFDIEEIVDVATDPETGETSIVRRNADGSMTTSTGRWETDNEGGGRFVETDEDGTRRETAVAADGTIEVTKTTAEGTRSVVTEYPDGDVSHREYEPDGGTTTTTANTWDHTLTTERRDADGNLIETFIQRPDGWTQRVDPAGNVQFSSFDESDRRTVIELDADGNSMTTVFDAHGDPISRERVRANPMEPGRTYYEDFVGGTEWDALPESHKTQHRNSERQLQETARMQELRDLQTREDQLRREAERALQEDQAERDRAEWDRMLAEQLAEKQEYQQLQEERRLAEERQQKIASLRREMRELDQQQQAAAARGDTQEAQRLEKHHDELHDELSEWLTPTVQEQQQMQRRAAIRDELMSEIARGSRLDAEIEIFEQAGLQDIRDSVMDSTGMRVVFGTSEYERQTSPLVRSQDRQRAWGRARREQIDRMLDSGDYTSEQIQILHQARQQADEQERSAQQWLTSNSRIRNAGYAVETASSLIPTGWAARAVGAPVRAAGGNAARRAAGEAASEVAGQNASRIRQGLQWDVGQAGTKAMDRAARAVAGDAVVDGAVAVARTNVGEVPGIVSRALGRGAVGAPPPSGAAPGVVRLTPEQTRRAMEDAIPVRPRPAGEAPLLPSRHQPHEARRAGTVVDNAPLRDSGARTERIRRVDEIPLVEGQPGNPEMIDTAVRRHWQQAGELPSITQVVGDDVLPMPRTPHQEPFTAAEVRRMFEPGRTLTGPEIVRKGELLVMRERARNLAEGARGAKRTALEDYYRQVDHLAQGEIPTIVTRHTPYSRSEGVPLPRDFAEMPSILDAPPPFMRPGVEGGRTLEMTLPDFPPVTDSSVLQAGASQWRHAPLRPDAHPTRPTVQWPDGLSVQGRPGPGVHRRHLETAQEIANRTGEPLVIAGARQVGARAGHSVATDADLRYGVIGSAPVAKVLDVARDAAPGKAVKPILERAIESHESIQDALDRGYLVVTPQPENP